MHIRIAHKGELRDGTLHCRNFCSIARGIVGNPIGADKSASAWLIDNNDTRFSRDVAVQVARQQTGHNIRTATS